MPFLFGLRKKPGGDMAGFDFKRCKQTAMTELKKKRFLIYFPLSFLVRSICP